MRFSWDISASSRIVISALLAGIIAVFWIGSARAETDFCTAAKSDFADVAGHGEFRRVVCAEVAALDQVLVYNRFGSHNPFGMIFALTRDLVPLGTEETVGDAPDPTCEDDIGLHMKPEGLSPGNVRLRDCKRARPLTLRANVGDVVHVRLHNYLRKPESDAEVVDYSRTFCRQAGEGDTQWRKLVRAEVSTGSAEAGGTARPGGQDRFVDALCPTDSAASSAELAVLAQGEPGDGAADADWPRTRGVSFVIDGMRPLADPQSGEVHGACVGLGVLEPGEAYVDCYWHAEREGPFFINSVAAPSGGEGDGGSLTHGLFGSLAVEPQTEGLAATAWYRSQVTRAAFDAAWAPAESAVQHARDGALNFEAQGDNGLPVLNLLQALGEDQFELVHNELNAIIRPADAPAFREFTVVFHDELKTFYTRNFEELARFEQLAGVSDGFAINYGASGLGAMILANRKGIGPAADCMECLYEEFFLESWANGDPALLEVYDSDPSNVHHSYLNDPIVFRNYHAGPKETHVFHLHAHQWFTGNDPGRGTYLDSQTVAPRQGFTYNIYDGGLNDYANEPRAPGDGWWAAQGSGNRNRTVGDSIFHCHLYPHFAQGMWSLWRVHDVLEDGSRLLPDGQAEPGLSVSLLKPEERVSRPGSVGGDGRWDGEAEGTPVPALVPLPGLPAPLLPTYTGGSVETQDGGSVEVAEGNAVPGYPFFIAGKPGHRAPQPPLDIARTDDGTDWHDGGLPRHVVEGNSKRKLGVEAHTPLEPADFAEALPGPNRTNMTRREDDLYRATAKMLALGDFSGKLTHAVIDVLENDGEPLEKGAMAFHHDGGSLALADAEGRATEFVSDRGGYLSGPPENPGAKGYFAVNGAPPKPGAPFADPCGAPEGYATIDPNDPDASHPTAPMALIKDPFGENHGEGYADFVPDPAVTGFRRYDVSAVQVDIVTNKAGWHDPQGRINVLTGISDAYKNRGPSAREEPFFFRAYSGDCIEFRHTNELPKELELDDFQVKTPTDTIGQHIHLVKFDVTSADGSGNGFNYEDGTFAADEIALRLCAMLDGAETDAETAAQAAKDQGLMEDWGALCEHEEDHWVPRKKDYWSTKLTDNRARFQTTVQRWFADPILSIEELVDGQPGGNDKSDRTMRTVFTHDHFGPSSIQQHGFYSALVIEPRDMEICPGLKSQDGCMQPVEDMSLATGDETGVGVHKIVQTAGEENELHPDYREFALAVADFALLYDPSDSDSDLAAAAGSIGNGLTLLGAPPSGEEVFGPKGLAKLVCEAQFRNDLGSMDAEGAIVQFCASELEWLASGSLLETNPVPPAVVAAGLIEEADVIDLRRHLGLVRLRAGFGEGFARPVNPPERPESISVDHHDPYLVNYRGEPVPLRIGDTSGEGDAAEAGPEEDPELEETEEDASLFLPGTRSRLWKAASHEEGASEAEDSAKTAFECFEGGDGAGAILGQFGRRDAAGVGPRDESMPLPGVEPDDAFWQTVGEAGHMDSCSIDGQSDAERGDLANVYRSTFDAEKLVEQGGQASGSDVPLAVRPHGDPVTPLLETYTGERVQIRLIQGAQEVQHTFNIEGLMWRRNIDQKFPSEAPELDSALPGQTFWQACRDWGRQGIARQHDRWRNGTLKDDDDTAFWQQHSEMAAVCDNLEGFTTAQEVGISEHFEIPTAPSKYQPVVRVLDEVSGAGDDVPSLDYLYHFGSHDAVWNGAWGLMRVFERLTEGSPDVTKMIERGCPEGEDCTISSSLRQLGEGRPDFAARNRTSAERVSSDLAACPANAPRIESYAVAMPLEDGMSYASWGRKQRDPDGLALVHLPRSLALQWIGGLEGAATELARNLEARRADVENGELTQAEADRLNEADEAAHGGQLSAMLQDLRHAAQPYFRDEPMVIRGNAGDCLSLRVINALGRIEDQAAGSCGSPADGPRDCLGDALMPKIVKLNVEPDWEEGDGDNRPGARHMEQKNLVNVRPSDRLALTAPMSMLTRAERAHLPFGANVTVGVKPGEVHEAEYYLGFLRVDWPLIEALMQPGGPVSPQTGFQNLNAMRVCGQRDLGHADDGDHAPEYPPEVRARANSIFEGTDDQFVVRLRSELPAEVSDLTFEINLLGNLYQGWLDSVNTEGDEAEARPLRAGVLELVAQRSAACFRDLMTIRGLGMQLGAAEESSYPEDTPLHAQPYAFGAVPLKPISDIFNQGSHGLFGAVIVEPQGATYAGRALLDGAQGVYEPQSPLVRVRGAHRGRAGNTVIHFEAPESWPFEQSPKGAFREVVLFYQDGLNLWDTESANLWEAKDGSRLPIVDNCAICDDSYDLGEKAVSYRSAAFHLRLRQAQGLEVLEQQGDLNAQLFENDFFHHKDSLWSNSIRLWAKPGEEVVFRVIHPGGRARQRAFVTVGHDYDDLFPGFGFPHAALLAPGKAISAALSAPVQPGCSMWADGPRQIFAGGVWGLFDVLDNQGMASCPFLE